MVRINKLHDLELDRLRRLWAGAPAAAAPVAVGLGGLAAPRTAQTPSTVRNTAP